MGCQKRPRLYSHVFLPYFWRSRWCALQPKKFLLILMIWSPCHLNLEWYLYYFCNAKGILQRTRRQNEHFIAIPFICNQSSLNNRKFLLSFQQSYSQNWFFDCVDQRNITLMIFYLQSLQMAKDTWWDFINMLMCIQWPMPQLNFPSN